MGLRKAESQVKILLAETIMAMCRNTLNNHAEVNVEGLLGITLDNDEIFLVSINQTINNPDVPSKAKSVPESTETNDVDGEAHQRKRAKSKTNDSSSDSDEESTKEGKAKRRRKRKRRSKSSNDDSSSGSSESDEESSPVKSVQKVVKQDNDINSQDNNFDLDQNSYSVMPEQDEDQDNSLSNSENVRVKQERAEDDDEEDIVIIKEEMSDLHSDTQFMNMQQQFTNSTFPPDFNSTFPGTPQQSMSSDMSQPQPGPSSSNADKGTPSTPLSSLMGLANFTPKGMALTPDQLIYLGQVQQQMAADATAISGDPNSSPAKKYLCPLCGKCFNSKGHLNYHLVTHTGNKNYQCDYCSKSYGLKHNLQRHMKQSHPEFMPNTTMGNMSINITPGSSLAGSALAGLFPPSDTPIFPTSDPPVFPKSEPVFPTSEHN